MWTIIRRSRVHPMLSTTPSLPASSTLPLSDSAGGTSAWDRLESDIKALQQQALTTQKAIQQLQAREPGSPLDAVQSELPSLPTVDSTAVGVAAVLGLTVAVLWWYLWVRPQNRLHESLGTGAGDAATFAAIRAQPCGLVPLNNPPPEDPDSLFARRDPNPGFDSEAAASEVVRVRKSLAEKREARALLRERDEVGDAEPSVRAWLDGDAPHTLDGVLVTSGPIPMVPPAPPAPATVSAPQPQPAGPPQPDYTITLALAQESEALDLWPEARELATEVLDSSDTSLRTQAQAMLVRLDQLEQAQAQESLPPPEDDAPHASQFNREP